MHSENPAERARDRMLVEVFNKVIMAHMRWVLVSVLPPHSHTAITDVAESGSGLGRITLRMTAPSCGRSRWATSPCSRGSWRPGATAASSAGAASPGGWTTWCGPGSRGWTSSPRYTRWPPSSRWLSVAWCPGARPRLPPAGAARPGRLDGEDAAGARRGRLQPRHRHTRAVRGLDSHRRSQLQSVVRSCCSIGTYIGLQTNNVMAIYNHTYYMLLFVVVCNKSKILII